MPGLVFVATVKDRVPGKDHQVHDLALLLMSKLVPELQQSAFAPLLLSHRRIAMPGRSLWILRCRYLTLILLVDEELHERIQLDPFKHRAPFDAKLLSPVQAACIEFEAD